MQDGRDGVQTVSTMVNVFSVYNRAAEMLVFFAVLEVKEGVEMGDEGVFQETMAECYVPLFGKVLRLHS